MADRYPDAGLRVTAAQRDRAAAELREAAADERLSFDELEARLPTVLGAKTRGDLVAVLRDLVPAAEMGAVVGADAPTGHGIGFEWEHPWVIETRWDIVRQIGEWVLPPFMELVSGGGTIILNAIHASAFAPVTDIVLTGKGGVRIVVPEGWGVDTEGQPTSSARAALDGAMLTFGGHKGSALSTMIELMAGPLIGDLTSAESLAYDAGSKSSPYHGELIIALDPRRFLGDSTEQHLARAEVLFESIQGQGARLPSQRRYEARALSLVEGVEIPEGLYNDLKALLE